MSIQCTWLSDVQFFDKNKSVQSGFLLKFLVFVTQKKKTQLSRYIVYVTPMINHNVDLTSKVRFKMPRNDLWLHLKPNCP